MEDHPVGSLSILQNLLDEFILQMNMRLKWTWN